MSVPLNMETLAGIYTGLRKLERLLGNNNSTKVEVAQRMRNMLEPDTFGRGDAERNLNDLVNTLSNLSDHRRALGQVEFILATKE